ncbi:MAG: TIGR02710 family CRISPR-associated CARF protein [Candidatus Bathyarchaeia archaeon]
MGKALVISVGTGTRPGDEAINSLAGAIAFSIKNNHPDKVFFVASKDSVEKTLPRILQRVALPDYEIIDVEDPDNIRKIYEDLRRKFVEIRSRYPSVVVDYTSGTKAMTGALVILGSLFEVDTLSYVSGKRTDGVVIKGAEELQSVRPYFVICDKKIMEAKRFFNECRFDTASAIIEEVERIVADKEVHSRIAPIKNAASAYSAWDKFKHAEAFKHLEALEGREFDGNKSFLGRLLHSDEKEPYLIADLINNAKRRGDIEKKYDDAVGRLYRVVELVAQYRLRKNYGINSSDIDLEKIPPTLKERWKIPAQGEKIKLGLERDYELLAAKGDEIGEMFLRDEKLRDLLSKRNFSILAHGSTPVNREVYERLLEKAISYGSAVVESLQSLLRDSEFAKFTAN